MKKKVQDFNSDEVRTNLVLKNHGTRAGGRGLKGGLINIPTDKQPLPWRRMEFTATPEQEMNISAKKSKDKV